jgi:lipopolysaccharide transport system ATP-binding protein
MSETVIKIENLKKQYRLGLIGGGTLQGDIQSWWARVRGKEDPNSQIGSKIYKNNEKFMALDGIDLEVKKGERLGIIGHNGAGKSTLLKLLSRVTAPTEGTISIKGRISSMLEVGTGFNGELTGRENIYLNGAILGMSRAEVDSKIDEIIEFSECSQFIDTPVKRYSSGMYVKLAFAVAAHLDSEILIMDEVLAVGDVQFQKKCLNKMSQVSQDEGRTVLYVSHNMATIRQLCEKCIVMSHGKIIFEGDVEEAISIYSGEDSSLLPRHYDLDEAERPAKQHGHRIRLTSFDFLDKDMASFDRNEEIKFDIGFKANESIPDLKLYFTIKAQNDMPVGMTQTMVPFLDCKEGKEYHCKFKMKFPELAEGKYYFYADIFSEDGTGRHWSYDHPVQKISFEITDDNQTGLRWNKSFGRVKLHNIEFIK